MISESRVELRPKRLADARNDYAWQQDPELSRLDATAPLTCSFDEYFSDYASELQYPSRNRRSFAIETADRRHIGNCVYYNIDEAAGEAELGIMIGDRDYWGNGYGTEAVTALVDYIFRRMKLSRIYLKTLVGNTRAQKCFQKCHFEPCGYLDRDGFRFLLMDVDRERWQAQRENTDEG